MARRLRTSYRPIHQEQWSVVIPRVGDSVESVIFRFDERVWYLKLETRWDNCNADEEWVMYIIKLANNNDFQKFWLTAYIRDGLGYLFMAHKEISSKNAIIWSCRRRAFSASYPGIRVNERIHFSFELETLKKISQNFVDKSVQTPSPVVPPSYSDDRFCLNNLSLALRKLGDEGLDSDVQLKCGECSIAAHKIILGIRSEVFRTMLQSNMLERRQGVIEIADIEPKVFEVFIRYLYTGILPELADDTAKSLYEAADKYHVEALRRRCGDFMAGNLTRENALRILAMAEAHSDKDLKDEVVTYVLNEKIPSNEDEWSKFCDDYPKLAIEVLNRSYSQVVLNRL